jgi:hypothetical protein
MGLQGISRKGPRGYSCKAFNKCVIFHLLTVFPNNMAEQEMYYITNMLKKPQHISMCQFLQRVEQLNSYIVKLLCWHYSPSAKPSMIPTNVPFTEADLASHILWICPLLWQNHFNFHKIGMTLVDMLSILISLEAIQGVCTQEKSNAKSNKKASNKGKKGNKRSGAESTARDPIKLAPRSIATSARSMGACILCKTQKNVVSMRSWIRKSQFPCHQERQKET